MHPIAAHGVITEFVQNRRDRAIRHAGDPLRIRRATATATFRRALTSRPSPQLTSLRPAVRSRSPRLPWRAWSRPCW